MFRVLALVLVMVLAIAACGDGDGDTNDGEATAPDTTAGDTEAAGGGEPSGSLVWDTVFGPMNLDPGNMRAAVSGAIVTTVYDRLLTYQDGEVVPLLAESYEVSDDTRTFTFKLREDVTFADGTPLTSADVEFSYNRLKYLEGSGASFMSGLEVSAPDEYTVVLESEASRPGLLVDLTGYNFGVLNSARAQEEGAVATENAAEEDTIENFLDTTSLGSGPYVVAENDGTSRVVLEANENYWGEQSPTFEQIVLRATPPEAQLLNVQAGESDLVVDVSPEQAESANTENLNVEQYPAIRYFFVAMNTDCEIAPTVCQPEFMDAVRYAIDYDSVASLAGPSGTALPGLVPSFVTGALAESDGLQRDVDRAEQILSDAGLEDASVRLEFASDNPQNGIDQGTVAQVVQQNLEEVGIQVELAPSPLSSILPRFRNGEIPGMNLWTTNQLPDPSAYLDFCPGHASRGLRVSWEESDDPEMVELCEAAATAGFDEREAAFQEWQRAMNERGPFVPLFHPAQVFVTSTDIANAVYNPALYVDLRNIRHAS